MLEGSCVGAAADNSTTVLKFMVWQVAQSQEKFDETPHADAGVA